MASRGAFGLIGLAAFLVAVVIFLPWLRNNFAPMFPEGFRDQDCKGVTCGEGQFCQSNKCSPVMPSITNNYWGSK
jgi:hypothetical protein